MLSYFLHIPSLSLCLNYLSTTWNFWTNVLHQRSVNDLVSRGRVFQDCFSQFRPQCMVGLVARTCCCEKPQVEGISENTYFSFELVFYFFIFHKTINSGRTVIASSLQKFLRFFKIYNFGWPILNIFFWKSFFRFQTQNVKILLQMLYIYEMKVI